MVTNPSSIPKRYWVYILECGDGTYYTGYTTDLGARFQLHSMGKGAKYTRGRGPLKLAYFMEYQTQRWAMRQERKIKKLTRAKKKALIDEQEQDLVFPVT